MDMAQVFIFDLGWVFFIAWGTILVVVSIVAFGRDVVAVSHQPESQNKNSLSDRSRPRLT
jgi:hypothetical protein